MSVQRSPPKQQASVSGINTGGGSHPDLSKLNTLTVDSQITFRKRKQPLDEECGCSHEIKEIKSELTRIGSLLERYVGSNEQIINKMQDSLSEVKTEITELKSFNEQTAQLIRENATQIKDMKLSMSDISSEQNNLKSKVLQLENKLSRDEENIKSLESSIQTSHFSDKLSTSNVNIQPSLNEHIIKEVLDRNNREKNVIILGLPEQTAASAVDRATRDEADILKITTAIGFDLPKPKKVFRLGKYSPGKTRSIKLCFDSPTPAKYLLRNKEKLPENLKIFSDQTPAQQKYLRHLKEELTRRQNEGENDLTIKYVHGTPTIVKTSSKN